MIVRGLRWFIAIGALFIIVTPFLTANASTASNKGCYYTVASELFNVDNLAEFEGELVVPVGERVIVSIQYHSCVFDKSIVDIRWIDSNGITHRNTMRAGIADAYDTFFQNDAATERITIDLLLKKSERDISFKGWVRPLGPLSLLN